MAWPVSYRGEGRAVSVQSTQAAHPDKATGREWAVFQGCSQEEQADRPRLCPSDCSVP